MLSVYISVTTTYVSIIDYGMYKVTERIAFAWPSLASLSLSLPLSLLPTIMITSIHHHSRPCPTRRREKREEKNYSILLHFSTSIVATFRGIERAGPYLWKKKGQNLRIAYHISCKKRTRERENKKEKLCGKVDL